MEWACQACGRAGETDRIEDPGLRELRCEECGEVWELAPAEGHIVEGRVERCRFCGSGKLFVQKAFNRGCGLLLVVIGGLVALLLGVYVHPWWFAAVLLAFVGADLILYRLLPLVDCCYRCRSVYHGFEPVPEREGFDLDLAEWNERQFTLERDARARRPSGEGPEAGSGSIDP